MTVDLLPPEHTFAGLAKNGYGVIYADPPWRYEVWSGETKVLARGYGNASARTHYETMSAQELSELPVADLAAENSVLLIWVTWPTLSQAMRLIEEWGFTYKTCGFCWIKARANQIELFDDSIEASMGMGYWTRANSEVCLLATRGSPKRVHADVRQGIIAPRREHSRKPAGIHARIERLVAGPYVELFARSRHAGWDVFGNQTDKFAGAA